MSIPPPEHEAFKIRLRHLLSERGLSIYAAARLIDPDNPELAERSLFRWLSPSSTTLPSPASRRALARALGVDEDFFVPSLGADAMLEIARAHAWADLNEDLIRRARWAGVGGVSFGGHYLSREQRELIGA
jgi:transcriptional regulator with XRE-family HTH domain